jgi:hypothetical protein
MKAVPETTASLSAKMVPILSPPVLWYISP